MFNLRGIAYAWRNPPEQPSEAGHFGMDVMSTSWRIVMYGVGLEISPTVYAAAVTSFSFSLLLLLLCKIWLQPNVCQQLAGGFITKSSVAIFVFWNNCRMALWIGRKNVWHLTLVKQHLDVKWPTLTQTTPQTQEWQYMDTYLYTMHGYRSFTQCWKLK